MSPRPKPEQAFLFKMCTHCGGDVAWFAYDEDYR